MDDEQPVTLDPRDLEVADLAEVRRRVVDPVVAAVLRPAEVGSVDVAVTDLGWAAAGGPPAVWVTVVDASGLDRMSSWVGEPGMVVDAAAVAEHLYSDLQDYVAESGFGWGELREGRYVVGAARRAK